MILRRVQNVIIGMEQLAYLYTYVHTYMLAYIRVCELRNRCETSKLGSLCSSQKCKTVSYSLSAPTLSSIQTPDHRSFQTFLHLYLLYFPSNGIVKRYIRSVRSQTTKTRCRKEQVAANWVIGLHTPSFLSLSSLSDCELNSAIQLTS